MLLANLDAAISSARKNRPFRTRNRRIQCFKSKEGKIEIFIGQSKTILLETILGAQCLATMTSLARSGTGLSQITLNLGDASEISLKVTLPHTNFSTVTTTGKDRPSDIPLASPSISNL